MTPPPRTTERPSTRSTSSRRAGARARADRSAHKPLRPFTVDHFRAYARLLVLDTLKPWEPEDWQLEVAGDFFAGNPEVWLLVPEENGKTTFFAGFALYHGDYTHEAMVGLAAASRDQAGRLLGQAVGFVRRSPGAKTRFRPLEGHRLIRCKRTAGLIQVFAAAEGTGDGIIYTLALIDELHRHRDLGLYRVWLGKDGKRAGQLGVISTAGAPGSEFEQVVGQIRRAGKASTARDGHERIVVEASGTVMHRYAVPDDGDVEDLEQVKAANPFSGITIQRLRRKRAKPGMTDPHWRRLTCNQPVRGEGAAINAREWAAAITKDRPKPGTPVYAGLDLGWQWDTTVIAPLWVPSPGRRVLLDPKVVVPPRDGTSTRPSEIQEAFLQIHRATPIHTVVMDKAAGGEQLAEWIEKKLGARVVVHSNGNQAQALAAQRFYEGLRAQPPTLQHTGHPVLTEHVLNARARMSPRGDVVFDRPTTSRSAHQQDQRVIDGLSASSAVHSVAVAEATDRPKINVRDYRIERL
ncbi:MAG: hypothetical protein QOG35_1612 [Solirubrobacteraceae bacterium]|jgi:phage terminase large subunit-like protein|nr:hypothetical protein [Solirubrobacteraceae bacterium]